MRSSSQETGHRARVADSKSATAKPDITSTPTTTTSTSTPQPSNFEYDDNEWDIGIGDLIIDLDADIEKTNEGTNNTQSPIMAANTGGAQASKTTATAKMHIEHSATADKGLKMKIKRTKPGTKTSEAKHEIVKSNEQNGNVDQIDMKTTTSAGKHNVPTNNVPSPASINSNNSTNNSKRGSSGHRRDKTRDKHNSSTLSSLSSSSSTCSSSSTSSTSSSSSSSSTSSSSSSSSSSASSTTTDKQPSNGKVGNQTPVTSAVSVTVPELNGIVKVSAPQNGPTRSVFPASTGPGPPQSASSGGPSSGPPSSPAAATAQGSASKPEQTKIVTTTTTNTIQSTVSADETRSSPPPMKKMKTESRVSLAIYILFGSFKIF